MGDVAVALPFTIAVMVAGWYGGFGPGLVATILSTVVCSAIWMRPHLLLIPMEDPQRLTLGLLGAIGIAVSAPNQAVRSARLGSEHRAEELERREEACRRILETASEGIRTLEPSGRIAFANRTMADLLGTTPEALAGRDCRDLIYADDRPAFERRLEAVLERERRAFEVRLQRRDGSPLWAQVSSAPIIDSRRGVTGVLGMFTDVTARHRAEEELQRLLASEQRARAEAESANRAKDEFLATVSHELRTPLNAMLGWLSMMRSGALDPTKVQRAIEVIERNARSQAKLIEDLLDVSRMISGKLRLDRKRIGVTAIAQSALDSVRPAAAEKEIGIERAFEAAPDLVAGDPERIKQVLTNLLSNAVKFTPHGGRIGISVNRRASPGGDVIAIEVSDTGQGIAAEFPPHVFDRFRQQDASMTRKHSGLGLGLAIVRHVVEGHGGTVSASSGGPGRGSTFTVALPALADTEAELLPRTTPALSEVPEMRPPSTALRGSRLLVVDDELDSLEMLRELLQRAGAEVRTASSAREAFVVLSSWRPDLVVSDLAMPEEDGYDLLGRVRALTPDRGGSTPAIALTAHARLTDRLRVLSSGFQAYLAKPVEPEDLIATARRVLGTGSGRPAHA